MLTLDRALRLGPHSIAALVGAGGKTTALSAASLAMAPCYAAATSHLGDWQAAFADRHVVWPHGQADLPPGVREGEGVVLVTGPGDDAQPHRLRGLDTAQAAVLCQLARQRSRPLFFEADGSRCRPLKAPAPHEPPIPEAANLVVVVAGLSGLGRPIGDADVHRPERFAALAGCAIGAPVTPERLARVLAHPDGGRRHVPPGARCVVLLNQADDPDRRRQADLVASRLLPAVDAIVVASLRPGGHEGPPPPPDVVHRVHEPIAATILAAGASTRFGRAKPLLDYQGRPFVRAVAESALAGGLSPVQVVTGDRAAAVAAALAGLPVEIVHNPDWQEGQAASVRAGVTALPAAVGGTVFLMADQPHVPPALLRALVDAHAESLDRFVAPSVGGARVSPVLFDRSTFPSLLALRGDVGGRAIIYAPRLVAWPDDRLAIDVDTQDDYRALLGRRDPGAAD